MESDARRGFTLELWKSSEHIYRRILDHPFLKGLTDGTLPKENFKHYAVQDALYLRDYARALALVGVRSKDDDDLVTFCEHAAGAIVVERSLHEGFFKEFGLTEEDLKNARPAPTTLAYTSYLLRVASLGDYPEALCAVLPCYWIYAEVGKALLERGSPEPMYERWIETYGGEEFDALVEAALDAADRACEGLDEARKAAAMEVYVTTSRYEWTFWDAGWRLERWPV